MKDFNLMQLIAKYWLAIVIITAVVFGASLATVRKSQTSSYGVANITVRGIQPSYAGTNPLIVREDSNSGTLILASTTQSWLTDPAFVKSVVDQAGVTLADSSLKGYTTAFKVQSSVANSLDFQVLYTGKNDAEVTKVYQALTAQLNAMRDTYNAQENAGQKLALMISEPVLSDKSSSIPLTPVAGLVVGFIFSLVVVAFLDRKRA